MAVPNIFGSATAAIPLSQLDTNFATPVTIGNTAVQLGNTVTSFGNVTLTNVTISSGNVTITGANVSGTANVSTLIITGNQTSLGNVSITGNVSANIATFGAGSNTAPAITTTGDTNTGIFFPAADTIAFSEGGAEAMRIDSSGNVGIGTTTPAYKFTVDHTSSLGFAVTRSAKYIGINANAAGSNAYSYIETDTGMALAFNTNGANERMRIDSSGRVLIGTATPNTDVKTLIKASSASELQIQLEQSNVTDGYGLRCSASDGDLTFNRYVSSAYTERMRLTTGGNLTISGATATKASGTTWANPSDQRLKNNIRDYDKGTAELMQVRVREWEYNGKGGTTDGMKGLGVIADEVMTVLPATVENYDAKLNADDEETTAIKQFDATEITWLLVKTVQEQQALITALTARITALENK